MMININNYIYPELIITDLKASTREEAIRALVDKVFEVNPDVSGDISSKAAYDEVMGRETLQTTGLGQHMAFPHSRIKGWRQFVIAIGILKNSIDFNSLDGEPVSFVCLMISSSKEPYLILQAMAAIIRFIHETDGIKTLFRGLNANEIAEKFKKHNISAEQVIMARDIMRPVKASVTVEETIEDAARAMHLNHLDILPVVDKDNRLAGQISCFDIFTYGVPDFFTQLNTVSFVRKMDPFEKYFKIKKDVKVKDFCHNSCPTISPDTTLFEIIFEIAVKNKPKLFVLENKNLIGEIDRYSIIDKILFF